MNLCQITQYRTTTRLLKFEVRNYCYYFFVNNFSIFHFFYITFFYHFDILYISLFPCTSKNLEYFQCSREHPSLIKKQPLLNNTAFISVSSTDLFQTWLSTLTPWGYPPLSITLGSRVTPNSHIPSF